MKIDFVSDIACPWCVVGAGGLTAALEALKAEGIEAEITFRPFELNPGLNQGRVSEINTGKRGRDIPPERPSML